MGLAGIHTIIVCEAHGHAKHANIREVWGHAPGNFEKLHSLILNLRAFLVTNHPLILLWTGTQNFLYRCNYSASCKVLQKLFMLLPFIANNAIVNDLI